jgi:mannose-6-phosphate isomerase-like protein (cupin superfamily)
MINIAEYIKSGILEMYVLGLTSDEENTFITNLARENTDIKNEIEAIEKSAMLYAEEKAGKINTTVKPMITATIDYTERLKAGEVPRLPPVLNKSSKVSDYAEWLERPDMMSVNDFNDIYVKIIGHEPAVTSAIVWIKNCTEYEVHKKEYEKFLIVEGTCDIVTDEQTYSLKPGDYLSIPLHIGHEVKVTSLNPCKVILQRVAA